MAKEALTIKAIENHVNSLANDLISAKNYFTASELLEMNTEEIPCLLAPLLPKTGLCGFGGTSDVGKSSFLRQLSTHIVLDKKEFLGFRLNATHKSVIYVSTEDDETALSWLLKKQQNGISYNNEDLQGLRFLLDSNDLLQQLDNKLSEQSADLVILDAFSDIYFDKINDEKYVSFLIPI